MNDLVWYRFKTKSVQDYRPLIDMKEIQMPWWCTGSAMDSSYVIIVWKMLMILIQNQEQKLYIQIDFRNLNGYKN